MNMPHEEKVIALSETLPKWLQVASAIKADIERRIRDDDLRLPTEASLCKQYGVSLVTIRQALSSLEARGLITRRRKLGTVIRKEALSRRTVLRLGLITDVIEQQQSDWTELLDKEVVPRPDHLEEHFSDQVNIMRFTRRRFSGGEPGNYAVNYVRLDVAAQLKMELIRTLSLTQIIHEHTDFKIGLLEQELRSEAADPLTADLLGVEPLSPTIVLSGRTYDREHRMLDLAHIVYRGDMFSFLHTSEVSDLQNAR